MTTVWFVGEKSGNCEAKKKIIDFISKKIEAYENTSFTETLMPKSTHTK